VTDKTEFLTRHSAPPKGFTRVAEDLYARPRQFDTHLLATFPAFGPPAIIVIGQAQNTDAKASTPWLITLMHEHFHQLQDGQPGYFETVEQLGLSGGDTTGMWMLNYPFPYERPEVVTSFSKLRDLLLNSLVMSDPKEFRKICGGIRHTAQESVRAAFSQRSQISRFSTLAGGNARYTQIKAAETAANYQPTVGLCGAA